VAALIGGPPAASAAPRSSPSYGPDVVRRIGLGMVSPETPLGVRYLTGYRTGFEVGVGWVPAEAADGTDVYMDGGALLAMAPGHDVSFFLRPGIRFSSEHRSAGTFTTVGLSVGFSFQWFVTRDFSLTATQGLRLDLVSPPEDDPGGSDDRTRIVLFGEAVPRLGFFYYLPEF
jgi:hypothetical protein